MAEMASSGFRLALCLAAKLSLAKLGLVVIKASRQIENDKRLKPEAGGLVATRFESIGLNCNYPIPVILSRQNGLVIFLARIPILIVN